MIFELTNTVLEHLLMAAGRFEFGHSVQFPDDLTMGLGGDQPRPGNNTDLSLACTLVSFGARA